MFCQPLEREIWANLCCILILFTSLSFVIEYLESEKTSLSHVSHYLAIVNKYKFHEFMFCLSF